MAFSRAYVYLLSCEKETLYVGFTRYLPQRIETHFIGGGSMFTRTNKPLSIFEVFLANSTTDEYRIWCAHAHVLGYKRVGGYSATAAAKEGFEWEYPQALTKCSLKPTQSLLANLQAFDHSKLSSRMEVIMSYPAIRTLASPLTKGAQGPIPVLPLCLAERRQARS